MSHADARYDAEGYQYGVRFRDGGVAAYWNGRTQRERASQYLARIIADYGEASAIDYALVRHRDGEPWEECGEAVVDRESPSL